MKQQHPTVIQTMSNIWYVLYMFFEVTLGMYVTNSSKFSGIENASFCPRGDLDEFEMLVEKACRQLPTE